MRLLVRKVHLENHYAATLDVKKQVSSKSLCRARLEKTNPNALCCLVLATAGSSSPPQAGSHAHERAPHAAHALRSAAFQPAEEPISAAGNRGSRGTDDGANASTCCSGTCSCCGWTDDHASSWPDAAEGSSGRHTSGGSSASAHLQRCAGPQDCLAGPKAAGPVAAPGATVVLVRRRSGRRCGRRCQVGRDRRGADQADRGRQDDHALRQA